MADVDGDGLEDIYFVNQLGGNQLWRNLGGGRLGTSPREAGVALADRVGVTASFADIDNDGDQDLFVTTVRGGNVLFENDGLGRFKDISKAGRRPRRPLLGRAFFDYDNDGLLDLLRLQRRPIHDRREGGGAFEGLDDAFSGHLHPDRCEFPVLYRNLGRTGSGRRRKEVGLRPRAGAATRASPT